jgi:hypothetical protein
LATKLSLKPDDLLGRQAAVREFMTFLAATAQKTGRQPKGWAQALTRAARLTGFSVADLQKMGGRPARSPQQGSRQAQVDARRMPKQEIPTARDRAELFILGYLLSEPGQWADAQKHIAPEDFSPGPRRKLAETYWRHQQDEGEPVLNDFLLVLEEEPEVRALAVQTVQEISRLSEAGKQLGAHLEYLHGERARLKLDGHQAQLRSGAAQDEVALWELISASARVPDPRRLAVPYGA